jgi:predicted phage-related endonuclease
MQIHDLIQGSEAWDQFRLQHFGASEAAAMLGLSRNTTRNELLRMKKTGIAKEFSDWVQRHVLDRGHAVEDPARKIIEAVIGETLYPVTCSDGEISASCDGLSMAEDIALEIKQWNEEYAAIVRAGQVPEEHMPQCQQVLMVTKAEVLYFAISDGTRERTVWVKVLPSAEWFARIRAGWQQFAADLSTYTPTEVVAEVVGRTPEALPSLHIVLKGEVSASNLAEFKDVALTAIRSVNRDLKSDQDFADSAKARKWCEDIEARVAAAKENALGQTASIDMLFRTMDEVSNEAREVRLALEKLEKARKETRKGEIVAGGVKSLADHVAALNTRIGKAYMPAPHADFGTAIKGLKTFDSMQNAVDTELANAKVAASAVADRIDVNLKHLAAEAADHMALFPDEATIVLKAADDFAALVQNRISDFNKAEEKRKADEAAKSAITPEPVAAPVAAPAPTVSRFSGSTRPATVEVPDTVSAFLASRPWPKGEDQRARAILVEYEKFRAARTMPLAA